MDWDDLRVFLAVARAGRVSTAARRLGVRHTTVSRRLAALETDLGVLLFHRTATGYRLTPQGQNALANAETMEAAALTVGARARERSGALTGSVRLALIPEFASQWLAPHLPVFRKTHPGLDLRILVGTRQRDLSRGEADLAVQTPRPRQPGLATSRIAQTSTALYASRAFIGERRLRIDGPATARDVPLLVYTEPFHILQNARWFQPVLRSARIVLETNSTQTLLAAAKAGLGAAVLPPFVAREENALVCISQDTAVNDVWLITHAEVRRDPRIRAVADFLKQVAGGPDGLA